MSDFLHTKEKAILALDGLNLKEAIKITKVLGNKVYAIKIHDLFDTCGPTVIMNLKKAGAKKVWVDYKLYDIPTTARLRAKALAKSGCDIISVHASGGIPMMKAVKAGFGKGEIYAVTLLTSHNEKDTKELYLAYSHELVRRWARLAKDVGVKQVVCSPQELTFLSRDKKLKGMKYIVPGTRSKGEETHDQKRTDTPANAMRNRAEKLVIGRQITKAEDLVGALEALEQELASVQ